MLVNTVFAIFVSFMLSGAAGAPTKIGEKALKQNAEAAQHLNNVFQGMSESTPCSNMQKACINGSLATCTNGAFQLKKCSSGESCFVVPNTKISGTTTLCATEDDAKSVIQSAGGEGGIFGTGSDEEPAKTDSKGDSEPKDKDSKTSDEDDTGKNDDSDTKTGTSPKKDHHCTESAISTPSEDKTSAAGAAETVTVTVTRGSEPSTTILASQAETLTLDPAAASSLIASLTSAGASIVTTIAPTASPASARA
jgi:hypothetical protein